VDAERPGALIPAGPPDPSGEADPAERLRRVGLRATRPRRAVLEGLVAQGGHRTADELVAGLASAGAPVPRSTVFAVLDDLVAVGVVRRAAVGAGPIRYELATAPHHHLVCAGCGAIVDVPGPPVGAAGVGDPAGSGAVPPGAVVDVVEVVYRGWCPDCATGGRA